MPVELVQTVTPDGVRLDGAWQPATMNAETSPRPVEAWIIVHGTGGSFYSSTLLNSLAERLTAAGMGTLRVNTRGFGLVNTLSTAEGPRRGGAAYERLDECRHDLAGWIRFLAARGMARIGLLGHSSGALKVLYSQAYEPDAAVERIIALSPPRLAHGHFLQSAKAAEFAGLIAQARGLVEAGRGETLMEARFPLPLLITAEGYLEKYGPEERYDLLKFLARLRGRVLFTYGGREVAENVAFQGLPDQVFSAAGRRGEFHVEVIANADHFYTGQWDELAARISAWLP